MVTSIAEIIKTTRELKTRDEKIAYLKANESDTLKFILRIMFDRKNIKLMIPDSPPPYTPSTYHDNYGALYNQARKLRYIVQGLGAENLTQSKREQLFIEILETVHRDDALVLLDMIAQPRDFKGLTVAQVNAAFDNMVPMDEVEKEKVSDN